MKNLTTKNPQGKWWTYGTYNPSNKNGREVVGIKISKEFKELINSINEGDYINFRESNNGGYGSDEIPF